MHIQSIGAVVMVRAATHMEASQSASSSFRENHEGTATSMIVGFFFHDPIEQGRNRTSWNMWAQFQAQVEQGPARARTSERGVLSQVRVEREDESGLRGVLKQKHCCA